MLNFREALETTSVRIPIRAHACSVAILLLLATRLSAADVYVATTGSDTNPGTKTAPLESLAVARDAARSFVGKEAVTVHVADGVYYLPDTLVFTPADSGTERYPIAYVAENEGGAVLSGGMKTTIIRDSRWRCDHGWDIDLDDGSSNYDIYNNLMLNGGLKFREGFRRRAWNNIMVNNSFHPHVWYANSGDEFHTNIVMTDVKGIRAPTNTANQQVSVLGVLTGAYVEVETSDAADGFANLSLPSSPSGKVAANQSTANQPVEILVDGRLTRDYGPVFRNGVRSGAYKMDLGQPKVVTAVSSWSFHQSGKRGTQRVTIYGSGSATDPGWDLRDRDRFTPLGTIDTTGLSAGTFNAASLRARNGRSLAQFRWIIWSVYPVTTLAENTAFQELSVEVSE